MTLTAKLPSTPVVETPGTRDLARDPADLGALDRWRESVLASFTGGLSPESFTLAWADWAMHLAGAPGKRLELALQVARAWLPNPPAAAGQPSASPQVVDSRFSAAAWQPWPFAQWARGFQACEDWWTAATTQVPGVQPHHAQILAFVARQWLDMVSPSNLPWANPEVWQRTAERGGVNLLRGAATMTHDMWRQALHQPPEGAEAFEVGVNLAVTPGDVVMRTHLAELIQYQPSTPTVWAEPILIVPAWIMKYYILDLSPHNSLVRWLVDQGHTVYCLSWRNVTADDSECALDDYRTQGVAAALDAIGQIQPRRRVHAMGYCLGGTLLSLTAAAMARDEDHRLASVTLLAAQTDFTEPGALQTFIDPSQVHMLDSMMARRGYLSAEQMSGAFQMLQSKDLVWSRAVHDYLMDERAPMNDLMAWNADATRMPYRMHSEYLHRMFLDNALAAGRYTVDGRAVLLQNIRVPIFAVGTERDHVAPWTSVYKIHGLTDTEVTFLLTNGGHNAGIVNEPGHAHRHFRVRTRLPDAPSLPASEWLQAVPVQEGSWWPAWQAWLQARSSRRRVAPPRVGQPHSGSLGPAPGTYVMQR